MKSKMLNLLVSPHHDRTAVDTYVNLPTLFQFTLRLNFEGRNSAYTNLRTVANSSELQDRLNTAHQYIQAMKQSGQISPDRINALEKKINHYQSELDQFAEMPKAEGKSNAATHK